MKAHDVIAATIANAFTMATRVVIAGGPNTGKTTLARALVEIQPECKLIEGDDFIELGWSEASLELAKRFADDGPWIVEGVAGFRALRKAMKLGPPGVKPCDLLVRLTVPRVELNPGQARMAKGCETVFQAIRHELRSRGVAIMTLEGFE